MKVLAWMAAALLLSTACSPEHTEAPKTAILSGVITVDGSNDLAGIVVDITFLGDTLFKAQSDIDGYFGGVVRVPQKGAYSMTISRNNRVLHIGDLILAPGDTLRVTGAIPRLAETFTVQSLENNAWATLTRMNRQFDRLIRISTSGVVPPDSVVSIVKQWSDLYWSFRDTYPGTFAADQASRNSIEMLVGVDEPLLMNRLSELGDSRMDFATKMSFGSDLLLSRMGLDAALGYVDSLHGTTRDKELQVSADMRRVELMLLAGDAERSLAELATFRKKQAGTDYDGWAEALQYELIHLVPGKPLPEFSIATSTDSVSNTTLRGKPYVLEFVAFGDAAYDAAFADLQRLQRRAAGKGIRFVTVPLDTRPEPVAAFIARRKPDWAVAPSGAFAASTLAETLRIDRVPVRYLVGSDGLIIGRYFTYDITALQADLNPLLTIPNL